MMASIGGSIGSSQASGTKAKLMIIEPEIPAKKVTIPEIPTKEVTIPEIPAKKVTIPERPVTKGRKQAKKLTDILPSQKYELCLYKEEHPNCSTKEILQHFSKKWLLDIPPSMISKILLDKERWFLPMTRQQKLNRLEERLYLWNQKYFKVMTITDDILRQKANTLAEDLKIDNFNSSDAWIQSFKVRHEIAESTAKPKVLNIDLAYLDTDREDLLPSNEKVHFISESGKDATVRVSAPITEDEACQGLLVAMGHLAAYNPVSAGRIDSMWDLLQTAFKHKISGDQPIEEQNKVPLNMNMLRGTSPRVTPISKDKAESLASLVQHQRTTPDATRAAIDALLKTDPSHPDDDVLPPASTMEVQEAPHAGEQVLDEDGMIHITSDADQYYLIQMASGNYEVVRKLNSQEEK